MNFRFMPLPIAAAILAVATFGASATTSRVDFARFTDQIAGEQAIEATIAKFAGSGGGAKARVDLVNAFDIDGVTLSVTGWNDGFTQDSGFYAYLDGKSGRFRGGLGVCKGVTANGTGQCARPSDDNLSKGEGLRLEFAETWALEAVYFRNRNHHTKFNRKSQVFINGDSYKLKRKIAFGGGLDLIADRILEFAYGDPGQQVYIEKIDLRAIVAPVPLPASALLLAVAMAGFGYGFRKRGAA